MTAVQSIAAVQTSTLIQPIFIKLGRYELVIEKTAYRSTKRIEVWKEPESSTPLSYNSPHYFFAGLRMYWSKTK
jgi:hypothetical protein